VNLRKLQEISLAVADVPREPEAVDSVVGSKLDADERAGVGMIQAFREATQLCSEVRDRAVAGHVSTDGVIVAIGADPPVVIVLSPHFADGSVKWECRGYPKMVAPMSCRGDE
jgi:hypothetical protein